MKDQKKSPGNGAFLLHALILKEKNMCDSKTDISGMQQSFREKEEHAPALVFICHMDTVVVGDG